jgi:dephospho-CoA kinase
MSLIYITGPAGIGKTSSIKRLQELGYEAYDADDELCGWYDCKNNKVKYPSDQSINLVDWENKHSFNFSDELTEELAIKSAGKLVFVCGNALGNDLEIADKYFDKVICLVTDVETMKHRIKTRQADYGKNPAVLELLTREFHDTIERYRSHGATMIDATQSINKIADEILDRVGTSKP